VANPAAIRELAGGHSGTTRTRVVRGGRCGSGPEQSGMVAPDHPDRAFATAPVEGGFTHLKRLLEWHLDLGIMPPAGFTSPWPQSRLDTHCKPRDQPETKGKKRRGKVKPVRHSVSQEYPLASAADAMRHDFFGPRFFDHRCSEFLCSATVSMTRLSLSRLSQRPKGNSDQGNR